MEMSKIEPQKTLMIGEDEVGVWLIHQGAASLPNLKKLRKNDVVNRHLCTECHSAYVTTELCN